MRVLLVGESAPDPGDAEGRFFYAPRLSGADNLFRSVVTAFYSESPGRDGDAKAPWLERLRRDGVFLIDLVPYPVNGLPERQRRAARRAHVADLTAAAAELAPAGVIVCHTPTFELVAGPLTAAGVRVLHDNPIPFPIGTWRARFNADVREALARLEDAAP
ncbi:MAG TPA: hypothetical protein VF529_03640 [Solirubrobacteraceae bacterium]